MDTVPKIPVEYVDYSDRKKTHLTKTTPRRWTQSEIDWCLSLRDKGYTYKEISESVGRSEVSVSIKMKRMTKSDDFKNIARVYFLVKEYKNGVVVNEK